MDGRCNPVVCVGVGCFIAWKGHASLTLRFASLGPSEPESDDEDLADTFGSSKPLEKRRVFIPVNNNPFAEEAGGSHWYGLLTGTCCGAL